MESIDTKMRSWEFWKRWLGWGQKTDENVVDDAPCSASHSARSSDAEDIPMEQVSPEEPVDQINEPISSTVIDEIDQLKAELDALRPLTPDVVGRIEQKLRIESNYHSNAIEGNSLDLGETRSLILHGLTAHGKPMRDHLDVEGHDEAVKTMEDAVNRDESLNEVFIRNLHKVLLKEPYEIDAITGDGQPTKRLITIGQYKTQPNNVKTSTGEIYYYTPPQQVKPAMSDLIDWYRRAECEGEHPIVIAATFHYRFVRIHPFDDGNGRLARLLMNMILIKHGYTVAIIPIQERNRYIGTLEQADRSEDLAEFVAYVAGCCEYSLNLHLRASRGEEIEDEEDIDKEIALFKQSIQSGPRELFKARSYAENVLYPFFLYCREKCEQFSDIFEGVETIRDSSSVKTDDNRLSDIHLSDYTTAAWPKDAVSVSTLIRFMLTRYLEKPGSIGFSLSIENDASANGFNWEFSLLPPDPFNRVYKGNDLVTLRKIFNEMLRHIMTTLSKIPGEGKDGE